MPHFYCFLSPSTFLLFSLLHHHHISAVFPPPPNDHHHLISIVSPPPPPPPPYFYFFPPPTPPHSYCTRPYLNEIPAHFIHEIKTKGCDVIGGMQILRDSTAKKVIFIPLVLLLPTSKQTHYNFKIKWSFIRSNY